MYLNKEETETNITGTLVTVFRPTQAYYNGTDIS
jgi:hypothetical protein